MTSPTMMGQIGLGSTAAGGVMQVMGALNKGEADSKMYNYKAGMAEVNARIARQNSDWALDAGESEAVRSGKAGAQTMGKMRAAQGASGLDVNSGSAVQVQESQQRAIQQDQKTIRQSAARKAYSYDMEAWSQDQQAGQYRTAASESKKAGTLNALGSIVSTASSVSNKWLQGRQQGLWGSDRRNDDTVYSGYSYGGGL